MVAVPSVGVYSPVRMDLRIAFLFSISRRGNRQISLHGRRFARSVVAQEGRDLVLVKVQTQVAQRHFSVGINFAQIPDADSYSRVHSFGLH